MKHKASLYTLRWNNVICTSKTRGSKCLQLMVDVLYFNSCGAIEYIAEETVSSHDPSLVCSFCEP